MKIDISENVPPPVGEAQTTGLKQGERKGPTNASLPIAFALEVRLPLSIMLDGIGAALSRWYLR